jgi:hypothetical protein
MDRPYPEAAEMSIRMYVDFLSTQPVLNKLLLERIVKRISNYEHTDPLNIDKERALQSINTYLLRHQQELRVEDFEMATFMSFHVSQLLGIQIASYPTEQREKLIREVVRMLSLYVGATFSK